MPRKNNFGRKDMESVNNLYGQNTQPDSHSDIKKRKILTEKNKKLIFYILMIAPLVLQVAIFYVYINISNFALAFSEYTEPTPGVFEKSFAGFNNFVSVIKEITSPQNSGMFGVSFLMYAFILFVASPLSIIFSFYVYKKFFLSEFFRVILFFPQIISTVVMTMLYSYMVGDVYRQISGAAVGLLDGETGTIVLTLVLYSLWMGFGANILLYSGAMSGINESVVESCHLDGCNTMQEFWFITMPSIYPTFVTFIVIDISAIFTNQMHLYTFFNQTKIFTPVQSVGYYMYVNTLKASEGIGLVKGDTWLSFPQLSAMGIMITMIVLPITLLIRRVLEKVGPSEN